MNEMIGILDKIQELEALKYDDARDRDAVLELYQVILDFCSEKEDFVRNSAVTMDLLERGQMSNTRKKEWLNYAGSIFASGLAVRIYENHKQFTTDEMRKIAAFFRKGAFHRQVRALGLYAGARAFQATDPMACYEMTREAFEIAPDLGEVINVQYRYEGMATEQHLTERCPICGSTDVTPHYCSQQNIKPGQYNMFPPAKLWMKCHGCRNYFTYDFPLNSVGKINGHYTAASADDTLKSRFQLDIYNDIFVRLKGLCSGTDYLEIGIGNGEMMAVAQEFGFHTDGVEICRADCERVSAALHADIKWCDVVEYETDRQYDAIVMGDVFEHVTDPMKVMRKVAGMLKEDGVLWLSTPNYNCAYARMEKFNHVMWHEPNHYTYVSRETLAELLDGIGLEIVHYDMSKRYLGSMELFIKKKA